MSRDWTKTLFPASYMGVPFWVETDRAETGRRLQVSELPGVDLPDIEDLGRKANHFEISGYFIGDVSDTQMTSLEQVCGAQGPGTLVLPAQGPQLVHCESIRRRREKKKMGYFGFEAKFVLATASAAPTSVAYLAQLVFNAAAAVGAAAPGFLNAGLSL